MSRPTRIRFLRFGGALAIVAVVIVALVVALQVPTSVTYAKKVKKKVSCFDRCDERYGPAVDEACGPFAAVDIYGSGDSDITNYGPNCQAAEADLEACYERCGGGSTPK